MEYKFYCSKVTILGYSHMFIHENYLLYILFVLVKIITEKSCSDEKPVPLLLFTDVLIIKVIYFPNQTL